jgi:hypothetical protein
VDAPITRRGAGASRSWRARAGAFELCGTTPRHFEKHGSLVELAPHWRPFRRPQRRTPDDDPALSAAQLGHRDHDVQRWQAPGPERPHHPLHRGRRHRARHLASPPCGCSTPRSRRPTAASARSHWWEVYAGEKAFLTYNNWLPDETVEGFKKYLVGIKGPLTTPIGGGIRSLNVALRQMLDLYVCLRPVRWFKGVPSPVKNARGSEHDHLPRELRGHLRRHRVRGGLRRREEVPRVPEGELPEGFKKIRFPESSGHRHQAGLRRTAPSAS